MSKKKEIEIVSVQLKARGIAAIGRIVREAMTAKFGESDFAKFDLGFELPDKFLQIDGPQPSLAQLTVLAKRLELQIKITHVELMPIIAESETTGKKDAG